MSEHIVEKFIRFLSVHVKKVATKPFAVASDVGKLTAMSYAGYGTVEALMRRTLAEYTAQGCLDDYIAAKKKEYGVDNAIVEFKFKRYLKHFLETNH